MKLVWDESAWADYVWWQAQDRKILKRINALVTDIQRNGNEGIGKPEPLKHGFQGYCSRRPHHRRAPSRLQDRRGRDPDSSLSIPLRALTTAPPSATARAELTVLKRTEPPNLDAPAGAALEANRSP